MKTLATPTRPQRLRAFGRGFAATDQPRIDPKGGMFDNGIIRGFSVCAVGPALGHNQWCDETFIAQISAAMADNKLGIKSRYTHGSMSGDGIEDSLGRATSCQSDEDQSARADLHFSKMANEEKRRQILDGANDTPEDFGASIAFYPDAAAELEFGLENGAEIDEDGWPDWSNYRSPDERNTENYRHVRLDELHRVDIVGDPAANEAGMFGSHDQQFAQALAMFEHAIGLRTSGFPAGLGLSEQFDPERMRSFAQRAIVQHWQTISKIYETNRPLEQPDPPASRDESTKRRDELHRQQAAAMQDFF